MIDGEIDLLLTLIDSVQPKRMIEFGVNEGITAFAVLQEIAGIEKYVGIDVPFEHQLEIPEQQCEVPHEPGKFVKDDPRFELFLRKPGREYQAKAGSFDVAFIDGDHGREHVLNDYVWARNLVRLGGLIVFHDYRNPTVQVTEVLDQLFNTGLHRFEHIDGTWLAFQHR